MTEEIGKVSREPLVKVWKSESQDFTPWLEGNIGILDAELGLGLSNPQREQPAGRLRADLTADSNQGTIVIENQFGISDHDHLGKLITYLAMQDTQRAIWIAENLRPEHVQAVKMLNDRGVGEVWFVKAEAIRIGNSPVAPLFTVVVEPDIDGDGKETGYYKNFGAEDFWEALFKKSENLPIPHARVNARPTPQLDTPAISGRQDITYRLAVNKTGARILCTNRTDRGLKVYDHLYQHKFNINREFTNGGELADLEWVDNQRSGRWWISFGVNAGYEDKSNWDQEMPILNDASVRLKKLLDPHLATAPVDDEEASVTAA